MADMPPVPANLLEVPKFALTDVHSPCIRQKHPQFQCRLHPSTCDTVTCSHSDQSMHPCVKVSDRNATKAWFAEKLRHNLTPQNPVQRVKKKGFKINPFFGEQKCPKAESFHCKSTAMKLPLPKNDSKQ